LIDDVKGHTLAAVSVKSEGVSTSGTKSEQAKSVGKILAEKAIAQNITTAVFDRSGYIYHGRVKALADGAREGGLQF
jgi:large subunit ribosomal protein L18